MDVLEARGVIAAMLAEKLGLTPGQTFFVGRIPPGVRDAAAFSLDGIRAWRPDGATECEAAVRGVSEDETGLIARLETLRDLLLCDRASGVLSWQLRDPVTLKSLPDAAGDLYEFVMPRLVSFV